MDARERAGPERRRRNLWPTQNYFAHFFSSLPRRRARARVCIASSTCDRSRGVFEEPRTRAFDSRYRFAFRFKTRKGRFPSLRFSERADRSNRVLATGPRRALSRTLSMRYPREPRTLRLTHSQTPKRWKKSKGSYTPPDAGKKGTLKSPSVMRRLRGFGNLTCWFFLKKCISRGVRNCVFHGVPNARSLFQRAGPDAALWLSCFARRSGAFSSITLSD